MSTRTRFEKEAKGFGNVLFIWSVGFAVLNCLSFME